MTIFCQEIHSGNWRRKKQEIFSSGPFKGFLVFGWPGIVPCVLPPLDDPPPVDQVEYEEEEGEEAEEGHVGPREPLGAGPGAPGHTLGATVRYERCICRLWVTTGRLMLRGQFLESRTNPEAWHMYLLSLINCWEDKRPNLRIYPLILSTQTIDSYLGRMSIRGW